MRDTRTQARDTRTHARDTQIYQLTCPPAAGHRGAPSVLRAPLSLLLQKLPDVGHLRG